MITICIISREGGVAEACRPVLDQLIPGQYEIQIAPEKAAQLYIWDVESVPAIPASLALANDSFKLVIVPKPSLSSIRASLPPDNLWFLNSPWTSLSLRIALESAISRLEFRPSDDPYASQLGLDRDQILQKLLETNARLQEYDTERTNFMNRAVHDIRVPLMTAHGYCGLLLDGQLGPVTSEQARVLEKMRRSLTRLGGLADALLDLGMGAKFSTKVHLQNSNLEACIHQAIHEILPLAEQKQISLDIDVEPPAGGLLFDLGQLEQVLVNLLDNACKFTPKRGSIHIRGYSVEHQFAGGPGSGYRIDVTDTGRGIPSERIDRVFDEYTSYEGSADRSGAGLGLAICRMVVNAHNGRIWASSGAGGSTFSMVLPFVAAGPERDSTNYEMKAVV